MNVQTEFTFAKLPESVQSKVLNRHRFDDVKDQWWGAVYEDAVDIGAKIGIEIGARGKRDETDISFSGFCSQGDGCSYSGYLHIAKLQNCATILREHVGAECKDNALFKLATEGEALYATITARLMALRMSGEWDGSLEWLPDGEISLHGSVIIHGQDRHGYSTHVSSDFCFDPLEAQLNSYVSGFADWIYKQLEAEHDHLTNDETVIERLTEIKFDEDGEVL